ncbi:MAG: hypothetical protein JXB62_13330 [Pirellulales bacterium]|nr:hypothetical protein [Pirellulales bacterium]
MVYRQFLRSWFHNAARQKAREKLSEVAREQVQAAAENASDAAGEPDEPRLGLIFALRIESGGLEDLLDGTATTRGHGFLVVQGRLAERRLALVVAGAGREAAARATEALIDGHQPQWVLSAGFAGGLNPDLKRNDVLMVDRVSDTAGNELAIDLKVDPATLARTPGVHVGRLLTADRVVRLPDEKRALGGQYDALAVDMETFAVAEVCRRRQVRFLAVRVVNDAVDETLPHDVEYLLSQTTRAARLGAAAGALWRRPSSFKDMFRLKENALLASERLAKFLAGMIEQL